MLKFNGRFEETFHLYLEGRRVSQARNQHEEVRERFNPGNEGDTFLRNVGLVPTDYTALYARRQNSHQFI
jgi:hypothetical protein